jgi:hypothetical protein
VEVRTGEEVLGTVRALRDHQNFVQRLGSSLPSEERDLMDRYTHRAENGHGLIRARIASDADAEHVVAVLRTYGAHDITRFARLSLTRY